ncbi:OmdA domain containing protein [Arthrobacter glacialis]|uniref:OmdA domain containing protein n=1 Tax=Arthrobacter glacialis TaxID=1664 RepID=A0A2S3ZWW1_ARTGL|nr:OmdA domain containing protein [Arthrobacter glacialis]
MVVEILEFSQAAEWESWLTEHQDQQVQAWLRVGKKRSAIALITIAEAADVGLCFGWIDGQRKGLDQDSFLQRYSRRRARSSWSLINVQKAEALMAAGRMHPSGLVEVDAAKADGRWAAAYEPQRTASVPAELTVALESDPVARAAFEGLGRSERYLLILPLLRSVTVEARAKALARILAQLSG